MAFVIDDSALDPTDRTEGLDDSTLDPNPRVAEATTSAILMADVGTSDPFNGEGFLVAVGEVAGSATFSGEGFLAAVGEVAGSATFSGEGFLVAVGEVAGSAAFSGIGNLAGTGIAIQPRDPGPGILGCPQTYEVVVFEENGSLNPLTGEAVFGRTVGVIDGWVELRWDRRLDDISEAQIQIETNADCCTSGFINDLHVWHHGVAIYRDGELVWNGPIVLIEATRTRVTLTANDVSVLLTKRLLSRDICFSLDPLVCTAGVGGIVYGPQSPEVVAQRLIEEALRVDDHGAFVEVQSLSAAVYEASYKKYGGPVFDLIQALATEFINWTVLGRRIVVSVGGLRTSTGLSRTALLTCEDFVNDTFKTTEDGFATLTQDVQIAAPIVISGVEVTNVGVAQIFDDPTEVADAYYGLLQGVQSANEALSIGADPEAAIAAAALNIVQGAYPPPISLSADGLQIAATAPVTIDELVPGVIMPVFADCLCRPVAQEFVLAKVEVTVTSNGETVVPTLISLGSDNAGNEEI